MSRYLHTHGVAGFLVTATFGALTLGCGGIEPTIRQPQPTTDHPALPQITAQRLQECVKVYGNQLEAGSWAFRPMIRVNQDGYVVDVSAGDMPNAAPDLAACTRIALSDMAIPSHIFKMR